MRKSHHYFSIILRVLPLLMLSAAFFSWVSVDAATSTFANSAPIAIPATGNAGVAAPYPSEITVSSMSGIILNVRVMIYGLSHGWPDDIDMLLVGPGGENVILMSDAGGSNPISGVNITFDQTGPTLPDISTITSGTYRPTDYVAIEQPLDIFPLPAPSSPWGTTLNVFNGTDPNGTWRLFIYDDTFQSSTPPDIGSISGGWALEITTGTPPTITSPATGSGTVGMPFSHTFTATGDPAPTLSYANENLPPGVTRTGDALSGMPTAAGVYSIDVTASNSISPDAQQTFTITITGDAPIITSPATGSGTVGMPFSHTFTAIGNPAPTLSYANEDLPPGVTRTGDALSGTPTAAGVYSIDVTASNSISPDAQQTFVITIEELVVPTEPPVDPTDAPVVPTLTPMPTPEPAVAVFPTPPDTPRCDYRNGLENDVVRAGAPPEFASDVFCRTLVQNGRYVSYLGSEITNAGMIGNEGLLNLDIVQAVDIFSPSGARYYTGGIVICLRGTGRLVYLNSNNAPRIAEIIGSYTTPDFPGYTCATLFEPGMLLLVRGLE